MTYSLSTARELLQAHGLTVFQFGGHYVVRRDLPAYGQRCPAGKYHHRHWRGFHASEVTLGAVRALAQAIDTAQLATVTSEDCGRAFKADKAAAKAWEAAGLAYRKTGDVSLCEQLDLGVAELRAQGATKMAQLTYQVLLESRQHWHPISATIAAIDRGRQPLAVA